MQHRISGGAPWFYEDDYEAFRALLPDRSWHPTYAEWETAAEANVQRLRNDGHVIYKAHIRSGEFRDWCAKEGLPLETSSLTRFGAVYAAEAVRQGKQP